MPEIWVHLPVDQRKVPPMALAARPESLKGLRVGLLDNGKEFSDLVVAGLGDVLRRDFGAGDVVFWRKGFPSKAAPFIPEMAPAYDVAVSGVGH